MPHPAHHTQNWESEQLQKARGNQLATGKHPEAWQAAGKQQVDPPKNRRHLFKLEKRPSVCLSACLFSPGRPNAAGTSLGQKRPLSAGIKGRRAETNSFPTWHFDLSSVTDRCPFGSPSPKSHFYPGGAAASPPPLRRGDPRRLPEGPARPQTRLLALARGQQITTGDASIQPARRGRRLPHPPPGPGRAGPPRARVPRTRGTIWQRPTAGSARSPPPPGRRQPAGPAPRPRHATPHRTARARLGPGRPHLHVVLLILAGPAVSGHSRHQPLRHRLHHLEAVGVCRGEESG